MYSKELTIHFETACTIRVPHHTEDPYDEGEQCAEGAVQELVQDMVEVYKADHLSVKVKDVVIQSVNWMECYEDE